MTTTEPVTPPLDGMPEPPPPTRYVYGLDLSIARTGRARLGHDGALIPPEWQEVRSAPAKGYRAKLARLRDMAEQITAPIDHRVALVVLEGPSYGSKGDAAHDLAGLWWLVLRELDEKLIPWAVAPPASVKKWAANSGSAGKEAVAVGVARLWPDVMCRSDNEWDAVAMATIGAQRLGWGVPSRAHHAPALEKIEWPPTISEVSVP